MQETQRPIDAGFAAIFRIESPKLIAGLMRLVRDVALAEELAQDAMVLALEHWRESGAPENPGGWLMSTAKNRAIDQLRRRQKLERDVEPALQSEAALGGHAVNREDELHEKLDDPIGDDLLRLIFVACHPVLSPDARTALTLRLIGGLTTAEIARAFLLPEPAIAQRIVRAKQTLAKAQVPFEVPRGEELAARLSSVLEVIYLIFNEGYSASAGEDWMRPALCEDALRLGRILAGLMPADAEAHGLLALLELQASRAGARTSASGEPILLLDQDRGRWNQLLIHRGLAALAKAEALGEPRGPYTLQAAIAACHARATIAAETDWARISAIYGALLAVAPSQVIELNRAIAVSMADGAAAGLALLDRLRTAESLRGYAYLPAARADLLLKLGRHGEARAEFLRAAELTQNARQRALLLERARSCE